ncbi:hypothetical protein MUK42_06466 [Musa troglodytarum]|uniref:Uncharacterized protein n=1 Tax=Musa troglodytarum TaxID=320322 RepID=A0A9E7L333_9LILI|nr:hypothetical protein MUK42_06466 [Musa troglodytarum]
MQISMTRNGGCVFSPSHEKIQELVSRYRFFVFEPHLSAALVNARSPVRKQRTHPAQSEGIVVT